MENVPGYVSITFILTTFLTIGFFFHALKQKTLQITSGKIVVSAITFWICFTGILAIGGFYLNTKTNPPNFIFLVFPTLIFIGLLFFFSRKSFIEKLPLKTLTLLHCVRIPVEIVLWWLYQYEKIPQVMTFEGRNFDILAGISAPLIYWFIFGRNKFNRTVLLIWNIVCLILLTNIVATAVLSLPTNFQQFGFEQPNIAVLYFPYIWLPGIIVPIVLFAHLASLFQMFNKADQKL